MSLEIMIYLAGFSEKLNQLAVVSLFIFCIISFLLSMYYFMSSGDERETFKVILPYYKLFFIFVFVTNLINTLIPSEKTMYLMAATTVSKEIANSDGAKTLYQKVFNLLDGKLDQELNKLTKDNK